MDIKRMNEIKRELGYSYQKISELSGVPVSTVQKILGGFTKSPRFSSLQALQKVLLQGADETGIYAPGTYYLGENVTKDKELLKEIDCYGMYGGKVLETAVKYGENGRIRVSRKEYESLPDTARMELIDGEIYDLGSPTTRHQIVAGEIFAAFRDYIRKGGGKCVPMMSPVDVVLDEGNIFKPDVMIICDRDKFKDGKVEGAPDLVVEVLSPSTKDRDRHLKLYKYSSFGVREYWIVDAEKERVVVYDFGEDEIIRLYTFEESVPAGIYSGKCCVNFREIKKAMEFL